MNSTSQPSEKPAVRTYRYRLYPTQEQVGVLSEILYLACWLYNQALGYRRKRWNESRRGVFYREQAVMWRDWRNEEPENNPLRLLNQNAGQRVLRRLDSAYRQFLKGERGRPKFKRPARFNSVAYTAGNGSSIRGNRLYIQNVGLLKVRWHRALPEGQTKSIVILRKPSGWYVLFQMEVILQPAPRSARPEVGVDMGIVHALALSDGSTFDSPRHLHASLRRLRVLERAKSRKQRGGANRRNVVRQIARLHERIANQRRDWWHKVTRQLVDAYGFIVLENLSLNFMLQNGHLSRTAHDIGLGMFRELLDYKAIEAGVEVVLVNPRNTSQVCSGCGEVVPKELGVRVHVCPYCGLTLDRDVNAALNVLALGRRAWAPTWEVAPSVAQIAPL